MPQRSRKTEISKNRKTKKPEKQKTWIGNNETKMQGERDVMSAGWIVGKRIQNGDGIKRIPIQSCASIV
jgi:hypothetical protein